MKRSLPLMLALILLLWPALAVYTADPPKPVPVVEAAPVSADDASAALAKDSATRQQACAAAIQAACERFRVTLQARPGLSADGRIVAEIVLVPAN